MKKLFSNVLEFVSYSKGNLEDELHKTILDDLSDFEFQMIKNEIRHKNINKDLDFYKEKCKMIKKSTEDTATEIKNLEKKLKMTILKKNLKVKYNQLSNHVLQY